MPQIIYGKLYQTGARYSVVVVCEVPDVGAGIFTFISLFTPHTFHTSMKAKTTSWIQNMSRKHTHTTIKKNPVNWKADVSVCQQLCLSRKLTASVVSCAILTVLRFLIADLAIQVSIWEHWRNAVKRSHFLSLIERQNMRKVCTVGGKRM